MNSETAVTNSYVPPPRTPLNKVLQLGQVGRQLVTHTRFIAHGGTRGRWV